MDKQQALEKAANERGISNGTEAQYIRGFKNGFSDAWDVQQYSSDAVATHAIAFAKWAADNHDRLDNFGYEGAYKLFNPSGAAPQPVDAIALLKKHLPAFGDWYSSYKNIDPPKSFETLVSEYIREGDLSAPQAAGPVWVKASKNCPDTFTDKIVRNIHTKNVYSGFLYKDATTAYFEGRNDDIYVLLTDLEWLNDSGQQVFTREQISEAFFAGLSSGLDSAQDRPFITQDEYMNTNYPIK